MQSTAIDMSATQSNELHTADAESLAAQFNAQNEFIAVESFLNADRLQQLLDALPQLEPHVHRNFIPYHKKGGSISRYDLTEHAPVFDELYRSPELIEFLRRLTGQALDLCPADDPHACALYYYTEAGDHIGFHYDTSYYDGERYTVLLGLVDDSSCELEYELYRTDPNRENVPGAMSLKPGAMVVFNGDKLWHRITPSAAGERRVALTLEYVTSAHMRPFQRFVSNMKDAIAYFGFRQVFARAGKR